VALRLDLARFLKPCKVFNWLFWVAPTANIERWEWLGGGGLMFG
jgi:hypothetical protein